MVGMILCLALAVIAFTISIRSFMEKGFLFNNAYLWAAEQERKNMDKKPHYRQSAIIFCMLGIVFLTLSAASILEIKWLLEVAVIAIIAVIVYAIVSSIVIETKGK